MSAVRLARIFEWAWNQKLDVSMRREYSHLGYDTIELISLRFSKDNRHIEHKFTSFDNADEVQYFAKKAAIALCIEELVL